MAGSVRHKKALAKKFDKRVDWKTLNDKTGKSFESLGRIGVADEATLPFNPRNSIDYPKVSTLARETSPAGLTAAEDALRTSHPLPAHFRGRPNAQSL